MLSDHQRKLYARHLLLPEIGVEGQQRLCSTHMRLPRDTDGAAASYARLYLVRAGMREAELTRTGACADGQVLAVDIPQLPAALSGGAPALREAEAALAGSLAAVACVRAALANGDKE